MSYETGGRGDKYGNTYENEYLARLFLRLVNGKLKSICVEPIGEGHDAIEYITTDLDNINEYYQCKGSNGEQQYWRCSDLQKYDTFSRAKQILEQDPNGKYIFVSPLGYDGLDELCNRARTCTTSKDFVEYQLNSRQKKAAFNYILGKWCLNKENEKELQWAVFLLSHCYFETSLRGVEARKDLEERLEGTFVGPGAKTLSLLEGYANINSRYGIQITGNEIVNYLQKQGIILRPISRDERILPKIYDLNNHQWGKFSPIQGNFIHRTATDQAIEKLKDGYSLVIHGKAGAGKSGCVEEIIRNLKANDVLYLAVKLDKHIPTGTADGYGQMLGLPQSPIFCLHALAAGKSCVLIFDQLDSLRWTSVHSASALDVCKEMIAQAEYVNRYDKGKMSLVFVSRTFDLEIDQGLKSLFDGSSEGNHLRWEKLQIGFLSDEEVKSLVGPRYDRLSKKMKEILRTPSSLFVWSKLESTEKINDVASTYQLMQKWWEQIQKSYRILFGQEDTLRNCKNEIVEKMESSGRLTRPLLLFSDRMQTIEMLISMGLLMSDGKQLSFVHQSFLDYFVAENDLQKIYDGNQLAKIFQPYMRQLPHLRYRFLLVLQTLLDNDTHTFIQQAREILNSPSIHFYFKCAVFEVIGQYRIEEKDILRFVQEYQQDKEWEMLVFQTVFLGHPDFAKHYFDGREPKWLTERGLALLRSISDQVPDFVVGCIAEKAFRQEETDKKIYSVLCSDLSQDTDEMFRLRMELLKKYPQLMRNGVLWSLVQSGSPRIIPLFELVLSRKELLKSKNLYWGDEKEQKEIAKKYYTEISQVLFPQICEVTSKIALFNRRYWTDSDSQIWFKNFGSECVAREMVELIKLAFEKYSPTEFLEYVLQGNYVHSLIANEIILTTMEKLPVRFSELILTWILGDFDHRIFVCTDSEKDYLLLTKKIIRKFSPHCKQETFATLEKTICDWKGDAAEAREIYRDRLKHNQEPKHEPAYWAYWGHLQKALLPELDKNRLSSYACALLQVLNRNKWINPCHYNSGFWSSSINSVISPIEGKAESISDAKWLQIVSVPEDKMKHLWRENKEGQTIVASASEFAGSMKRQVQKDPVRFAKLALSFPDSCYPGYITAVFLGIEACEDPAAKPDIDQICKLIRKYYRISKGGVATAILSTIKNNSTWDWPDDIYEAVRWLALEYPQMERNERVAFEPVDHQSESLENLRNKALNYTRGYALYTLLALLQAHPSKKDACKMVVQRASQDTNDAVRFADVALIACYYKEAPALAVQSLKKIFSQDSRALAAPGCWNILCEDFENDRTYYRNELIKGCQSEAQDFAEEAAGLLCAVAIFFRDVQSLEWIQKNQLSDEQLKAVCRQAVSTFENEEYKEESEKILRYCVDASKSGLIELSKLFRKKKLDPQRDKDFIMFLVSGKNRAILRRAFLRYLSESDVPAPEAAMYLRAISEPCLDERGTWHVLDAPKLAQAAVYLLDDNRGDEGVIQTALGIWDNLYKENCDSVHRLSVLLDNME